MAGLAITNSFMLGTATVMLGAQADLFNFYPTTHSLGLVKNFSITSEPTYTELSQGVKGTIVASVMTSNPVRATFEMYEYTAKNLTYALGLDGSTVTPSTVANTVKTAIAAPTPPALTAATVELNSSVGFTAGAYVMFKLAGSDDRVLVRQVVSNDSGTHTLTLDAGFPVGIPINTPVTVMTVTGIGSKNEQPFLAAAVTGLTANNEMITVYLPKVRVIKGFNLGFTTDNFGNMPVELTVYDLAVADPHYERFAALGNASGMIMTKT